MTARTKISCSIAETFSLNVDKSLTVEGFASPSPFTPAIDTNYLFRQETLSDILAWWQMTKLLNDGLYLTGPTGCGKSSIIRQIAARLNLSLQGCVAHSRMEMPELVGHHVVIDGDLVWQDGPLTIAMREGHIFLLDEMDLLDPATAAGLNGIVEGSPLVIAENGGEVIHPHEDFRFIATGNTNGGGDRTGLFQGTLQQNAALMDRMWVVEVGYATHEQEEAILSKHFPKDEIPPNLRTKLIEVANEVRDMFMGPDNNPGSIEVTLSTRTLVRWAHMVRFFQSKSRQGINPINYALDRALANRAAPETKTALHEIVQRHFGK